jgi:predicted HTH domain antitoxin
MKVEVEFPSSVLASLRRSPQEFAHELLMAAAAKWYESGQLSQERAAELVGCSRADFMAELSRLGVSPFQETPDELSAASQW